MIQEYCQVGKLQSQDFVVLDLLPALEFFNWKYLLCYHCAYNIGRMDRKWILLIVLTKSTGQKRESCSKSNNFDGNMVPTDLTTDTAFVVWFTDIKDSVNLYVANVEKSKKENTFDLREVKIDY